MLGDVSSFVCTKEISFFFPKENPIACELEEGRRASRMQEKKKRAESFFRLNSKESVI